MRKLSFSSLPQSKITLFLVNFKHQTSTSMAVMYVFIVHLLIFPFHESVNTWEVKVVD